SRKLISLRRSGSSSTSRMSLDGLAMIVQSLTCAPSTAAAAASPAASAAGAAAATATAAAADTIAEQGALHRTERFELLDRSVSLLLFVLDGALAFRDLRLQHRGELLDRGRARVALQHRIEQLQRALVVLRGLRERVEHSEADAIVIGALAPERLRHVVLLTP